MKIIFKVNRSNIELINYLESYRYPIISCVIVKFNSSECLPVNIWGIIDESGWLLKYLEDRYGIGSYSIIVECDKYELIDKDGWEVVKNPI